MNKNIGFVEFISPLIHYFFSATAKMKGMEWNEMKFNFNTMVKISWSPIESSQ